MPRAEHFDVSIAIFHTQDYFYLYTDAWVIFDAPCAHAMITAAHTSFVAHFRDDAISMRRLVKEVIGASIEIPLASMPFILFQHADISPDTAATLKAPMKADDFYMMARPYQQRHADAPAKTLARAALIAASTPAGAHLRAREIRWHRAP